MLLPSLRALERRSTSSTSDERQSRAGSATDRPSVRRTIMRSIGRFHFALARTAVAVAVALATQAVIAQEALDDQDPVDLDWVPAWDTPFWPVPSGAALEVAVGRTGIPAGSGAVGTERAKSGDYVLALLTLPLGARGRARTVEADADDADGGSAEEDSDERPRTERFERTDQLALGARGAGTAGSPPGDLGSGGATGATVPPVNGASADGTAGAASTTGERLGASSEPVAVEERFETPTRQPGRPMRRSLEVPFELLRAALEHAEHAAGLDASLRRLAVLGQRSRWSGLSPELRLRGATGIDQTRSTDSAGIVPGEETLRDASDSLVEVRLTFHLERLLYSGQEVALERARQQLMADRVELRAALGRELLTYRHAVRRLHDEELLEEDRADAEFDAERARLALFLLTDGWFRGEETVRRYEERPR